METLAERNTQICVDHEGKRVVDLWALAAGDDQFSPDSLVNRFISGKSLEALALVSLVGKGLLDDQSNISNYWPEFAASGKGELKVVDLMRHKAGLAAFNTPIPPEDLRTSNIKQNRVGHVIENHPPAFRKPPTSRRVYHAISGLSCQNA